MTDGGPVAGWPWVTLALLGGFHGLNPAMGWLFALALGLQERRRGAVLAALPPIALGHAASVAVVVAAVGAARLLLPAEALRIGAGLLLLGIGGRRLLRGYRHPKWVGMRVGFRDLVLWSFLMASAHGAGLMLLPVLLALPGGHAAHHQPPGTPLLADLAAVGVHMGAMFLVMAALALGFYQTLGLELLRRSWINLDLVWSAALVLAGAATLLLG